MKIQTGMEINQPVDVRNKRAVDMNRKETKIEGGDKVDFSAKLKRVENMDSQFTSDAMRQARIREVKERIEKGTYSPDLMKVAASLLKYIAKGGRNG